MVAESTGPGSRPRRSPRGRQPRPEHGSEPGRERGLEQWPTMTSTEAQPEGESHGNGSHEGEASPYLELSREAWADLAHETVSPLSAEELERLRGLSDRLDLTEVEQVYLPLSRLLSLYVSAAGGLHREQEAFLHRRTPPRTPFVMGVAGSVAVGKSTTARVLQQMLAHWPEHPNVALVTTDGFLYPNAE